MADNKTKLVPVDPTPEMLAAPCGRMPTRADVWAAMLAASPPAEAHPIDERYEHFLNYANLHDSPMIKYAYYHGADVGMDRPAEAPAERGEIAVLREVAHFIRGLRVFVTSRERIKHPEGTHLFDEFLRKFDAAIARLAAAPAAPAEGDKPFGTVCIHDGQKYIKWADGDYHYLEVCTKLYTTPRVTGGREDSARLEWLWNDMRWMDRYNRFRDWEPTDSNFRECIDAAMKDTP